MIKRNDEFLWENFYALELFFKGVRGNYHLLGVCI